MKNVGIVPDTKATAAMNQGWTVGRNTEIRPAVETAGCAAPAGADGVRTEIEIGHESPP